MSYIAERRQEEKERRRAEILDAAEAIAAEVGWEALTMDQVARKARLSRALLYVYFKDKTDLLFGIDERALTLLHQRFVEAQERHHRGIDRVEAIGRAYVAFCQEFPVYFDVLTRCELMSSETIDPESNAARCLVCGGTLFDLIANTIEAGIADGSIRPDVGPPRAVGVTLWGFMHGLVQVATSKEQVLMREGISVSQLMLQGLSMARRSLAPAT